MALWWLATGPLKPYTYTVELFDDSGDGRSLLTTQPVYGTYPFPAWQTPQFVIDRQMLEVPADFRPGAYHARLALADERGAVIYTAELGPLEVVVTERIFTPPPYAQEIGALFGDEIILLGSDLEPGDDGRAALTLVWQAAQAPSADYTVFVHLLYPDGTCCVWQQDSAPQNGTYQTGRWLSGEVVSDTYEMELPADLPSGSYPLEVGLYIAETGRRLAVQAADGGQKDAVLLPPLRIP
jgi:hypothetical protein